MSRVCLTDCLKSISLLKKLLLVTMFHFLSTLVETHLLPSSSAAALSAWPEPRSTPPQSAGPWPFPCPALRLQLLGSG